ncbi:restriction endonuclease subunit S [Zunongwangia atlantica]|uniref:Type I restriction enzyme specificity subunit n=1 Tax=Zunongwangia atlantica 22II14-10F7 TaxID=1185767 RepID=A0A1Y1SZS0_9FLAO|nr:restriction endonuclease subunit S [Zunongwangia atlantica]ORL44062.1 type I restriction enzyme specificity subunit [Zunongwangia atlantica 22II14-10F7]
MPKELPKNWVETDLLSISSVMTGKKDANFATESGKYNFFTCAFKPLKSDSYSYEGDVLILPGNGINVGEVFYYSGKFEAYQRTYIVSDIKIDSKYLFYHFKRFWREIGSSQQFGSATNYIKIGNFKNYQVQIPPLSEQERIVAKLDDLFARLDKIKASLDKIPVLLKNFRQQVLTQAVTGKLTEEWRKQEGWNLGEWEEVSLIDLVLDKPRNGYSPKGVKFITQVKSLSLGATTSGTFDSTKIKYLDIDPPNKNSHLWLKTGDILIQRSNSLDYVGTSAIYTAEDNEFIYPDIMMKVRVNSKNLNIYVNYALSTSASKVYFQNNASGTAGNMPKINQAIVSNIPINRPPLTEQKEIVNRVESLFAKADAIQKKYEALKAKIEQLPQAILHKAFKGELVSQLKSDGDARDLLKEIEELKKTATKTKKPSKTTKIKKYKTSTTKLSKAAEGEGKYK